MAYDGKLSADEVRIFSRVIDDLMSELADNMERYKPVLQKHPAEWIANQIAFWANSISCLRGLKSRIRDMERP